MAIFHCKNSCAGLINFTFIVGQSLLIEYSRLDVCVGAGHQLARFPLEPHASRTIIAASEMGCTEEAVAVLAMLSSESLFYMPRDKKAEAIAAHNRFASIAG